MTLVIESWLLRCCCELLLMLFFEGSAGVVTGVGGTLDGEWRVEEVGGGTGTIEVYSGVTTAATAAEAMRDLLSNKASINRFKKIRFEPTNLTVSLFTLLVVCQQNSTQFLTLLIFIRVRETMRKWYLDGRVKVGLWVLNVGCNQRAGGLLTSDGGF